MENEDKARISDKSKDINGLFRGIQPSKAEGAFWDDLFHNENLYLFYLYFISVRYYI